MTALMTALPTSAVTPLVVAKAPVPGQVKTRLAATVGPVRAAHLAAAALLDTLDHVRRAFPVARPVLSLAGTWRDGVRAADLHRATRDWQLVAQASGSLGERLAQAHQHVADGGPGPVLQVGMDTPHVRPAGLRAACRGLQQADAVVGAAEDGGWWALALRDPTAAHVLAEVPMSRCDTGRRTWASLSARCRTHWGPSTYDVDTADDAARAAAAAPGTRFAAAWREVTA